MIDHTGHASVWAREGFLPPPTVARISSMRKTYTCMTVLDRGVSKLHNVSVLARLWGNKAINIMNLSGAGKVFRD